MGAGGTWRRWVRAAALLGTLPVAAACAPSRAALPQLIATTPVPGATVAKLPRTIDLQFNHPLDDQSSWATLDGSSAATRDSAKGAPAEPANGPPPQPLGGSPAELPRGHVDASDPTVLRLPAGQVAPGSYVITWHASTSGAHAATADGSYTLVVEPAVHVAPALSLSPTTAQPGDVLEVTGRGFTSEAPIQLTLGDDDQPLKQVSADAKGGLNAEVRVPPNAAFGVQPLSATDASGARATAGLHVRWGGWPPLLAWTVGKPLAGGGQVQFSVSLRNRSDYLLEGVRIVLESRPPAELLSAEPPAQVTDSGISWDVGWLDRGTAGAYRATFAAGQPIAAHARVEFRHRRPFNCSGDNCLSAFVSETTSDSTVVQP